MNDYRKERKFTRAFKESMIERNSFAPCQTWPHNCWNTGNDRWNDSWQKKERDLYFMLDEYLKEIESRLPYELFIQYREHWDCDVVVDWLKEYCGSNWAYWAIQCDEVIPFKRMEWFKENKEGTIFRFADYNMKLLFKVAWG